MMDVVFTSYSFDWFDHLPEAGDGDADSLGVGLLELAHLGCLLDPEVDLVGVLAHHLQLDVLGVRHVEELVLVTEICNTR